MIMQYFSVRDQAIESFLPPFPAHTKGAAIRMFTDAVNNKDAQFATHKEDFSLWHVGSFDDQKGEFGVLDIPTKIMLAVEVASPA